MVNRPLNLAVVATAVVSSVLTLSIVHLAGLSIGCAQGDPSVNARDFFKSSPAPMTGGQEMRPRW